jgi:hypothetical protein
MPGPDRRPAQHAPQRVPPEREERRARIQRRLVQVLPAAGGVYVVNDTPTVVSWADVDDAYDAWLNEPSHNGGPHRASTDEIWGLHQDGEGHRICVTCLPSMGTWTDAAETRTARTSSPSGQSATRPPTRPTNPNRSPPGSSTRATGSSWARAGRGTRASSSRSSD